MKKGNKNDIKQNPSIFPETVNLLFLRGETLLSSRERGRKTTWQQRKGGRNLT
jgi:hypothetical protein